MLCTLALYRIGRERERKTDPSHACTKSNITKCNALIASWPCLDPAAPSFSPASPASPLLSILLFLIAVFVIVMAAAFVVWFGGRKVHLKCHNTNSNTDSYSIATTTATGYELKILAQKALHNFRHYANLKVSDCLSSSGSSSNNKKTRQKPFL